MVIPLLFSLWYLQNVSMMPELNQFIPWEVPSAKQKAMLLLSTWASLTECLLYLQMAIPIFE